jgi:hypothetical protein
MHWWRNLLLCLAVLAVFIGLGWLAIHAQAGATQVLIVPEGFQVQMQDTGVQLFRKDYKNGTPDYVQVIDFSLGASIQLLHGKVTETRPGKGSYGGNDARIRSRSLSAFWEDVKGEVAALGKNVFCVTNGQFFYMPESPTRLSLPLKVDGQVITDGYAINEHVGNKLMLELWPDHADIRILDGNSLYSSNAPDILGGLTVEANKRARQSTGRTFAGVDDRNGDGLFETVLIFNTRTALQTDAAAVLQSFGADKVIMLDGGGSTQLLCQEKPILYSERLIPQALAVVAGDPEIALQPQSAESAVNQPAIDQAGLSLAEQEVSGDRLFEDLELETQSSIPQPEPRNEIIFPSNNSMLPLLIPLIIGSLSLIVFFVAIRYRQASQEEYYLQEDE